MESVLKIYNAIEGPIHTSEIPDTEDTGWVVVCLVEQEDGSVREEEVLFDTFDEAYEVVSWFCKQIAPFLLRGYE